MNTEIDPKLIENVDLNNIQNAREAKPYQIILALLVLMWVLLYQFGETEETQTIVVSFIGMWLILGFLNTKDILQDKMSDKKYMQNIAKLMGVSYSSNVKINAGESRMLFVNWISNVVIGTCNGYPTKIYFSAVQIGKTSMDLTILEITFPFVLPNIVLMSDGDYLRLPINISLEGNFNKSFYSLSTEAGMEEVVYQIFTPDFMQWLIEHKDNLHFESKGSKLFIFHESKLTAMGALSATLKTDIELLKLLVPKFEQVKGDLVPISG